jgi:hypothetical protein
MSANAVPVVPIKQEQQPGEDLESGTPSEAQAGQSSPLDRHTESCQCTDTLVEGHVEATERKKAFRAMRETETRKI